MNLYNLLYYTNEIKIYHFHLKSSYNRSRMLHTHNPLFWRQKTLHKNPYVYTKKGVEEEQRQVWSWRGTDIKDKLKESL